MYQFSRALYLETRRLLPTDDPRSAQACRRVLEASERIVERLKADPEYVPDPARTLFREIRSYFSIRDQQRLLVIVGRYMDAATEYLRREAEREAANSIGQCAATTRKGTPCRRKPLPGNKLCPSHSHLESIVA